MVTFRTVDNNEWRCDQAPNRCPICHHAIEPLFIVGVTVRYEPMGHAGVELVFQCPQRDCRRPFLARYSGHYERGPNDQFLRLQSTAPYSPPPPQQPAEVEALSPQFVTIYAQAAAAEAWQLKEIAGCGYRKALEFLVKDFCVANRPSDEAAIKAKLLAKVIDEYVDDGNIKECARRATWLGNDETHYVRLWQDKDIDDLKMLISLTVSWVNTHLLTNKVLASMPPKAK